MQLQKGQTGLYRTPNGGQPCLAVVVRGRGAHQADINVPTIEPSFLQMVDQGIGPGLFEPHGFDPENAPPRKVLARLIPRYVPVWHAVVMGVPVAVGASALFEFLWHWLAHGGR